MSELQAKQSKQQQSMSNLGPQSLTMTCDTSLVYSFLRWYLCMRRPLQGIKHVQGFGDVVLKVDSKCLKSKRLKIWEFIWPNLSDLAQSAKSVKLIFFFWVEHFLLRWIDVFPVAQTLQEVLIYLKCFLKRNLSLYAKRSFLVALSKTLDLLSS